MDKNYRIQFKVLVSKSNNSLNYSIYTYMFLSKNIHILICLIRKFIGQSGNIKQNKTLDEFAKGKKYILFE